MKLFCSQNSRREVSALPFGDQWRRIRMYLRRRVLPFRSPACCVYMCIGSGGAHAKTHCYRYQLRTGTNRQCHGRMQSELWRVPLSPNTLSLSSRDVCAALPPRRPATSRRHDRMHAADLHLGFLGFRVCGRLSCPLLPSNVRPGCV